MTANESWITQGRQDHGRFGNGTAGGSPAGTGGRANAAAGKPTWARRYGWAAARRAAQRSDPAMPDTLLGPLILPNASMGPLAAARARRRFAFALEEARNGNYESALGHLFLGKPFPAEVDAPEPEKLPPPPAETATSPQGDPAGDKPGELIDSLVKLTEAERRWAEARVNERHKVEVIFNDPTMPTADFVVDGIRIELKSLSPKGKTDPEHLSARISSRLVISPRQSSNIAVDATEIPQLTKEIAQEGIACGLGAAEAKGKTISTIIIYTRYGEVTYSK